MSSNSIIISAESGWHRSQSDAESECINILDSKESSIISEEESNGGEYIGGVTSGLDITYDETNDQFKCSAERTLNFVYEEGDYLKKSNDPIDSISFEDYEHTIKKYLGEPPPIDITKELTERLRPKVDQVLLTRVRLPIGFPVQIRYRNVNLPLTSIDFSNLEVVNSNLVLSKEINTVNVPLGESILHIPYRNCAPEKQTLKRDFEFKISKGWKVEFQKKVISSTTIKGTLKFGSYGEASVEKKFSTEVTNTRTMTETKDELVRTSINILIAENTIYDIKVEIRSFEARRSFVGPIFIDGTFTLNYGNGKEKKNHKISDFLNEEERRFEISGFYANIDYEEMPVSISHSQCPNT